MKRFLKSFGWAGRGIGRAVYTERNMRIHLCAAAYVLFFSRFYGFSAAEYALLALVITGVIALELVNTAIERLTDIAAPGRSRAAGFIKDVAAGAVLVVCIGAVFCGFLLFWDTQIFGVIFEYFKARPYRLVALALSAVAGVWFVFGFGEKKQPNN